MSCGDSASENCTYQAMTSYSTTTDSDPCTYEICRLSADVCKLRIDFSVRISDCDIFISILIYLIVGLFNCLT